MTAAAAVVCDRPGRLRMASVELPADAALLDVEVLGLCATDRHIYEGRLPVRFPCVLGHEIVGRIARRSARDGLVGEPEVGDRVLVAPGISCGRCASCRRLGAYCERRKLYGITLNGADVGGGFAPTIALAPGTRVFRLDDDLRRERAVYAEIVAVAVRALARAFAGEDPRGATIAVLGFGPLGLAVATVAQRQGCRPLVVEVADARAALARRLGFEILVDGGPVDVVADCAGTPEAFERATALVRAGGVILEVGSIVDRGPAGIRPDEICLRDLRVVGSSETRYEDFRVAVETVASSPVDLASTVTHAFRFEELADPNAVFRAANAFKTMVTFGEERDGR
jgi:threonine dehydrogenase-like Zn-dependent dehydrogenase